MKIIMTIKSPNNTLSHPNCNNHSSLRQTGVVFMVGSPVKRRTVTIPSLKSGKRRKFTLWTIMIRIQPMNCFHTFEIFIYDI